MLNREILLQQSRLNLLNTISLRIMPLLAGATDLDGLVQISGEQIKEKGYMTKKLVPAAIEGLLNAGFLRKDQEGKLYNLFSCNTDANKKGYYYINLFKFFDKGYFKSMYKSRIKLLYYILSAKIPGTWHSVHAEKLYRNKTVEGKLALDIFEDFDDLMSNLMPLITDGIIEVKLGKESPTLTKKTKNVRDKIYSFCGKTNSKLRKKRTRGEIEGHTLHIRVSEEVLNEKTTIYDEERRSTLKDLETIASEYNYSIDLFSQEALEEVHMVKHKIHKEFGNVGIEIYRESLQSYFKYNSHSFARLMNNKEFGKVIKNHYVVPRIKMELTSIIEKIELKEGFTQTESFLRYFTDEAFFDDLILFDHNLKQTNDEYYKQAKESSVIWKKFADKVEVIYQKEAASGNAYDEVLELARQGVLTNKKQIEEEIKQKEQNSLKSYSQKTTLKPEIPSEIKEFKEKLRAKGLLTGEIKDIKCDF